MICLRLVLLTPDLESSFWSIVGQDFCDYYFYIYDWLLQKDRTQISLVLDDAGSVVGLMLVYNGSMVQLRGSHAAVEFMLDNLKSDRVDVQVPIDCEDIAVRRFSKFMLKEHITLLWLEKGLEQLNIGVVPERLNVEDAEDIAGLMHESYPKMWSEISAESVKALFAVKEAVWLGIKQDGKLAAFGYAMLTPKVSHVTWIATSPQHQNKGYATSIVSALVKECLAAAEAAIIYVMDENNTAKGIYFKVGFRAYKSYFFVRT